MNDRKTRTLRRLEDAVRALVPHAEVDAPDGGWVRVRLSARGLERKFASVGEFERHGLDVICAMFRQALTTRVEATERARSARASGNLTPPSFRTLHGLRLLRADRDGLAALGYPDAQVDEAEGGQVTLKLTEASQVVTVEAEALREDLMGVLAEAIESASS